MTKSDVTAGLVIGAGVGLLIQPILATNFPNYDLGFGTRVAVFLGFMVFAPLALLIAELLSRFMAGIYQFAKYAAVGTLNTFIDVGVLNLELFLFTSGYVGTTAFAVFKGISFLFATTNSFAWNKYWTFSVKSTPKAGEVASFYAIAIIGWVINVGTATLVKVSGSPTSHVWVGIVSPLAGVAASFIWNFIGYKYFVFKKPAIAA